jgi:hypothetical protein
MVSLKEKSIMNLKIKNTSGKDIPIEIFGSIIEGIGKSIAEGYNCGAVGRENYSVEWNLT